MGKHSVIKIFTPSEISQLPASSSNEKPIKPLAIGCSRARGAPKTVRNLTEGISLGKVAGVAGLEPVTSAVTGQRSNQLSYTPALGASESREYVSDSQWTFR